jgi:hypothetical protein
MQDSVKNTFIQSLKENRKGVYSTGRIYTSYFEGMAVFSVHSYIHSYTPTLTSPAASLADKPTKPYADHYETSLDVSSFRLYRVDGGGGGSVSNTDYTEWHWPLSGIHTFHHVGKISPAWFGWGGARPSPFTLSTIKQSCSVRSSREGRCCDLPLFLLYPYMHSVVSNSSVFSLK